MDFKTNTEFIDELRSKTKQKKISQATLDAARAAMDEYQKLPEELQRHERVAAAYDKLKELIDEHVNDAGEITVPVFENRDLDRAKRILDAADQSYHFNLYDAREGKRRLSRASATAVKPTETATTVKLTETATTAESDNSATAVKPTETETA